MDDSLTPFELLTLERGFKGGYISLQPTPQGFLSWAIRSDGQRIEDVPLDWEAVQVMIIKGWLSWCGTSITVTQDGLARLSVANQPAKPAAQIVDFLQ